MRCLRTLSVEEMKHALRTNMDLQQKWSRKLERIMYLNEEAPAMFIQSGMEIIQEHQEKIDMLENEMERRTRVQVFKAVVQQMIQSDAALQ